MGVDRLTLLKDKLQLYPAALIAALRRLCKERGELYLAGGTLRDWLIGRDPADIDLVIASGAESCCKALLADLGTGALVPLGEPENDTVRLVWHGLNIDISGFRGNATMIEDDLRLRDFTVNAMAVSLRDMLDGGELPVLIDPTGGLDDLERGVLRACDRAFVDDPLRILRGFRLVATLGFDFHPEVPEAMTACAPLIARSAAERISHELDLIMASDRAGAAFAVMADTTVLWHVIPELQKGVGLVQPGFHHLDVFGHSLETLGCMEEIFGQPEKYYPEEKETIACYIAGYGIRLKWAALLHDLGKPATMAVHPLQNGRITFYNHDRTGRDLFFELAGRLRWSNAAKETVGRLIEMHMVPFHLCNARRLHTIGRRAYLRLWKRAGSDLPGLFLLAMADSLASRGERKPEGMEDELIALYKELCRTAKRFIQPVLAGPKLVTGNDLIDMFHLTPGPVFSRILSQLEAARVEGRVRNRQEALDWIGDYLQNRKIRQDGP